MMFQNFRGILRRVLPWCLLVALLSGCGSTLWQSGGLAEDETQWQRWMLAGWSLGQGGQPMSHLLWQLVSGTLPVSAYHQLASGMPVLQEHPQTVTKLVTEEEAFYAAAFVPDSWQHRFEKVQGITLSEETQVLLYHTHNTETYRPTYGVSKADGKNGGVVQAAAVLQSALQQKYGVRTVHNTTLHDYPNYNRSYQNSLSTVQQLLQANPKVSAVFDIHRDAGFSSKAPTTATIHGRSAARIMLVVGANQENWRENLAFARRLEAKSNALYPGLLRDTIRVKETGRYNQQLHPHSVLLEIGSDLNTQEEADYAAECFAQVICEVLQEGQ